MDKAEQLFATVHRNDPSAAFDTLLYTIADAGVLMVKCPNRDAIDQFPAVAESWTDEPYYSIKFGKLRTIRVRLLSTRLDHRSPSPSNAPYHPQFEQLFA